MKRLLGVLLVILCFWNWPRKYKEHIDRITASGHICKPSALVIFLARCVFKFASWVWVGKVRLVGVENLEGDRLLVTPNHSSLLDAVVCFGYFPKDVWAMGADDVLRSFCGIPGLVATKMRTMPVDRSHGKTVIAPAANLIVLGNSMVMFPEGKIDPTGKLILFKPGAGVIGNIVYEKLGGGEVRVGIVPTAICYGRRDAASATNYLKMGFKWRKGCTIVFCKPIWFHELPADVRHDPCAIMERVKTAIATTLVAYNAA